MNKIDELKVTLFLALWLKDKPEFSADDLKKDLYDNFEKNIIDDYLSSVLNLDVDSFDVLHDKEFDFQNLYNEE